MADWLRPPCILWWWAWILTKNRHGGIPIPQGWITPTTYPLPPSRTQGVSQGRTKRLPICSDLWIFSIPTLLHPTGTQIFLTANHSKASGPWNQKCASRKDTPTPTTASYYIYYSQASASNGNQGYILHKILVFTFYYAIITLPIPYYKTYVIHGIIAHKQTNLIYG